MAIPMMGIATLNPSIKAMVLLWLCTRFLLHESRFIREKLRHTDNVSRQKRSAARALLRGCDLAQQITGK